MDPTSKAIVRASHSFRQENSYLAENSLGIPFDLSNERLGENKLFHSASTSDAADKYKILRTRVLQKMREQEWNCLGVTSPSANSGTSATAISLGLAMALDPNQTVVLLEANLRNPSFSNLMGLPPGSRIEEFLNSTEEGFRNYLIASNYNNLIVLNFEEHSTVTSEVFTSVKARRFISSLKGLHDTIIICDLPPVLTGDDVISFSPNLDAILLVIEDGKTKTAELEQSLQLLNKTPILGTVLNKQKGKN